MTNEIAYNDPNSATHIYNKGRGNERLAVLVRVSSSNKAVIKKWSKGQDRFTSEAYVELNTLTTITNELLQRHI